MQRREFVAGTTAFVSTLIVPGCRTPEGSSDLAANLPAANGDAVLPAAAGSPARASATSVKGKADLVKYAQAVGLMRASGAWNQQAQIHNNSCPHNNWFFLPWHRAYLIQFEQAVRDVLNDQTFALPYWDWSASQSLPPEFSSGNLAHQRVTTSVSAAAVGPQVISTFITAQRDFFALASGAASSQQQPSTSGAFEVGPHNHVHATLGGSMGTFMSPLDPIFWLHHCNIDRIWYLWSASRVAALGAGADRPTNAQQRSQWQQFTMAPFSRTVASVLEDASLPYSYEGVAPPPPPPPPAERIVLNEGTYRNPVTQTTYALTRTLSGGAVPVMTLVNIARNGQTFAWPCDDTGQCRNGSGQSIVPINPNVFEMRGATPQAARFERLTTPPPSGAIVLEPGLYRNPVTQTVHNLTRVVQNGAMTSVTTVINTQSFVWTCGANGVCVNSFQQPLRPVSATSYQVTVNGVVHTFTRMSTQTVGAQVAAADAPAGGLKPVTAPQGQAAFTIPAGLAAVGQQIKVVVTQTMAPGMGFSLPTIKGPIARLTLNKVATNEKKGYHVILVKGATLGSQPIASQPGYVGRIEFFGLDHHPQPTIDVVFDVSLPLAQVVGSQTPSPIRVLIVPFGSGPGAAVPVTDAKLEFLAGDSVAAGPI